MQNQGVQVVLVVTVALVRAWIAFIIPSKTARSQGGTGLWARNNGMIKRRPILLDNSREIPYLRRQILLMAPRAQPKPLGLGNSSLWK